MTTSTDTRVRRAHRSIKADQWDLQRFTPLGPERLEQEIALYKRTGAAVHRNRIVESHLRLVAKNARRYSSGPSQFDDLMLEGTVALMRALEGFDPSRGTSFTAFAACTIAYAVRDSSSGDAGVLRLPARERRKAATHYKVETAFYAQHGRAPDAHEWRLALPAGSHRLARNRTPLGSEVSLDGITSSDHAFSLVPADSRPGPVEALALAEDSRRVSQALDALAPAARESLRMHYGLGGQSRLSLTEIGFRLRLSPHAVELMIADAIRKLRRTLSSARLAV